MASQTNQSEQPGQSDPTNLGGTSQTFQPEPRCVQTCKISGDASDVLQQLFQLVSEAGLDPVEIQELSEKLKNNTVLVAVMALVKAGKSMLTNALVGQEFLPSTPEPETAVLVNVVHDPESPNGKLYDKSGRNVAEGRERILDFLRAINKERRDSIMFEGMQVPSENEIVESRPDLSQIRGYYKDDKFVITVQHMVNQSNPSICLSSGRRILRITPIFEDSQFRDPDFPYISNLYTSWGVQEVMQIGFTKDSIRYRISRTGGTNAQVCLTQTAKKVGATSRVLRAKCVDGDSMYMFSSGKGVPRQKHANPSSLRDGYCEQGSTFAVTAFCNPFSGSSGYIYDGESWMQLNGCWNQPYFELLGVEDENSTAHHVVVGEPVKRTSSQSGLMLGAVKKVFSEQKVAIVKFPDCVAPVEVSVKDLIPAAACKTQYFQKECAPGVAQDVEVGDDKFTVIVPQGRETKFQIWVDASTAASLEKSTEPQKLTQLEMQSMTLHVPVHAFQSISGVCNFQLMDTPGPNEAHAGLAAELEVSLKQADVILYVLDYTKLGQSDEQDMFEKIKSCSRSMAATVGKRLVFLLNKIDAKPVDRSLDDVKKSVAKRISRMLEGVKISPEQVAPISALDAFLGRQALDKGRLESDPIFVEEIMKRMFKSYKRMYKDSSKWIQIAGDSAEALIEDSLIEEFEKSSLQHIADQKMQILTDKVCDQLGVRTRSALNNAHVELASLQCTQDEVRQRTEDAKVLKDSLTKMLDEAKDEIGTFNHADAFTKATDEHFSTMKSDLETVVKDYFQNVPDKASPTTKKTRSSKVKLWLKSLMSKAKQTKFANKTEAEKYIHEQDETMTSIVENAVEGCCNEIGRSLLPLLAKLDSDLAGKLQPILNFIMEQTQQKMNVKLDMEIINFKPVDNCSFEDEIRKSLLQHQTGLYKAQMKTQTFHLTRKKPWFWFGIKWSRFEYGTWTEEYTEDRQVVDSFSLLPAGVERRWLLSIQTLCERTGKVAKQSVQDMITNEVKRVSDAVENRCTELLSTLCRNQDEFEGNTAALAQRTAELNGRIDTLKQAQACIEYLSSYDQPISASVATDNGSDSEQEDAAPPFTPLAGPVSGIAIQWTSPGDDENLPDSVMVGGRACADMGDGKFMVPALKKQQLENSALMVVDIVVDSVTYAKAFTYYAPGSMTDIFPSDGPTSGGIELTVATSPLGAPIEDVLIGGVSCSIVEETVPTDTQAKILLPGSSHVGYVPVEVRAKNGNCASSRDMFCYFGVFGRTGMTISLSDGGKTAQRQRDKISEGVCIGACPLQVQAGSCYYEVVLQGTKTSSNRALAVGFVSRTGYDEMILDHEGRVSIPDAKELKGVWLAGYDSDRGAQFVQDGVVVKPSPIKDAWRPLTELTPGMRLGVLWSQTQADEMAEFAVFVDGEPKVKVKVPAVSKDLFALVDLQGTIQSVSLMQDAAPPQEL